MTQVQPATIESGEKETAGAHQQHPAQTPIDRFLHKLSCLDLPAQEQFASYLRHKWRLNHKRSTLQGSFAAVKLFLELYGKSGKRDLKEIERADLEAFIEYVQVHLRVALLRLPLSLRLLPQPRLQRSRGIKGASGCGGRGNRIEVLAGLGQLAFTC